MKAFRSQLALAIVAFPFINACHPKTGNLTGNAYWRYNNYVGDKPDAGTEIFLFTQDTSKEPLKTMCDVQGNFSFKQLPVGEYILVARSRATTSSSADQMNDLLPYLSEPIISFPRQPENTIVTDFIDSYYRAQLHERVPFATDSRDIKSNLDSFRYYHRLSENLADSILNMMPGECPLKKWIYYYGLPKDKLVTQELKLNGTGNRKLKLQRMKVEADKTTSVVVDFGITYF